MAKFRNKLRNNERGRTTVTSATLVAFGMLLAFGCGGSAPDDLILDSQPTGLIFVKTHRTNTLNNSFSEGGNLFSLVPASPDGKLTNLTKLESGDVCDPEVSFDGLRVLFSMRRGRNDSYNIYEMNVDGSGLRQISNHPDRDDFDPAYLPNGRILFTSNRPGFIDEYNRRDAEVMHVMNKDGSGIEQISFNQSDDFDPIVLADGRIVYTRWEHHGPINRFPLFFTHPDGGGTFTFFSPHKHRTFFHPRQMATGEIVAVKSNMVNGDRGPIVMIRNNSTAGEPLNEGYMEVLTPEIETSGPPYERGVFKYPTPGPTDQIIVSYSPRFGEFRDENDNVIEDIEPDYGLYTINTDGSNLTLLFNDPDFHEYDAVVISSRPVPPVLASTLNKSQSTGVFTVENVYFRQSNDGQVRPDKSIQEVKSVMVIEGLPRRKGDRDDIGESTNFEQKRILGVAPVQPDGSFSIQVPANIPLSFNTIDSLGRALVVKRNWVTIRPGEQFPKCTGCHGPRGQDSGNPNPRAATLPPTNLNIPEGKREDVSFGFALESIVAAKCESCHTGAIPGGNLNLSLAKSSEEPMFSIAYMNLMNDGDLVREPFSRNSRLIDKLLGIDDFQGAGRHPVDLTDDELRKFMNWIDLGGQYR